MFDPPGLDFDDLCAPIGTDRHAELPLSDSTQLEPLEGNTAKGALSELRTSFLAWFPWFRRIVASDLKGAQKYTAGSLLAHQGRYRLENASAIR
jgi:hypothetical protein